MFNIHAYTIEFFSDIFIEPFFFPRKKTGSLKTTTKLIIGFKVNFVKTLETPYKF